MTIKNIKLLVNNITQRYDWWLITLDHFLGCSYAYLQTLTPAALLRSVINRWWVNRALCRPPGRCPSWLPMREPLACKLAPVIQRLWPWRCGFGARVWNLFFFFLIWLISPLGRSLLSFTQASPWTCLAAYLCTVCQALIQTKRIVNMP